MFGRKYQPEAQAHVHNGSAYPMQPYNGMVVPNRARNNGSDQDLTPLQFRRYVNASGFQDVQLKNGLAFRRMSGRRWGYQGTGYTFGQVPIIPGQQRGDVAGFHKRGPAPANIQNLFDNGPGSQPANPGGPGTVAGPVLYNPMTS